MEKKGLLALFRELSVIDNVVGVGRGQKWVRGENTGKDALIILVNKKYPRDGLKRAAVIPGRMEGTMTDVIEVGDIRLLRGPRTGECRPASPGISIGHYKVSAGTFGALVHDRETGAPLILSNNHVLANLSNGSDGRAERGDAILQPGLYDGGDAQASLIGSLERFIPLHSKLLESRCKIAGLFERLLNNCVHVVRPHYRIRVFRESEQENFVDCAVAAPVSPDSITADIMEIGAVAGIKQPRPGMAVKKSGRSSGLTYGLILATDVAVKVGLDSANYGVFADQILAGPMSLPGDSGSLVLTEDNYAVGLLFAGSQQATMINKIDRVLDALGVVL